MVKQVIRRVGVVSLAVIGAIIGAIIGLISGILELAAPGMGVLLGIAMPGMGALGALAIIAGLIGGAIMGFISGAILAILYNVATRFHEGVEIDLEPKK